MTIQDKTVETFAENFYRYHDALAPDFGGGSAGEWNELAANERKRYVAAARLAFLELRAETEGSHGELFKDWPSGGTEGRECGC